MAFLSHVALQCTTHYKHRRDRRRAFTILTQNYATNYCSFYIYIFYTFLFYFEIPAFFVITLDSSGIVRRAEALKPK